MPRPASEKTYPVGIVGESSYQPAIRNCRAGQPVTISHESDNPHDPGALCVESSSGQLIGYIGRDNWLRRAMHERGTGCVAIIKSIDTGAARQLGVVLDVTLADFAIPTRSFSQRDRAAAAESPLGRFLAGIFKGLR